VHRDLATHRIADEMDRRIKGLFDPADQNRRNLIERQWKRTAAKEETIAAEPDQIERMDVMFARQRLDIVSPPVR
jgi:hypothetical protein